MTGRLNRCRRVDLVTAQGGTKAARRWNKGGTMAERRRNEGGTKAERWQNEGGTKAALPLWETEAEAEAETARRSTLH